jgi:hypothetical protein
MRDKIDRLSFGEKLNGCERFILFSDPSVNSKPGVIFKHYAAVIKPIQKTSSQAISLSQNWARLK